MTRRRLAAADAAWLHMDAPTNRMQITGVLELAGVPARERLLALVRERLVARFPRFSQRCVHGPTGAPCWEDDPTFDAAAHLRHVALPSPADDEALQELVGAWMSEGLDPDRPLWDLTLVEGRGAGAVVIARIHHSLADGISLARVLLSITDQAGAGDPLAGPAPEPSVLTRGVAAAHALATHPERLPEAARWGAQGAAAVARLVSLWPDAHTPLRGPLGVRKQVAWAPPLPLDDVKRVARRLGGTVNDVLMASLTAALRAWLLERGEVPAQLRTLVPINLRPLDEPLPTDLGNQFGLVFLELPVGEGDPEVRFARLHTRMEEIKQGVDPVVTFAVLQAMGWTPEAVERGLVRFFSIKASLITTNVPGPAAQVTLAGVPLESLLFWVPQSGDVGLGVSLISYAGAVRVGFAADARRVPDPGELVFGFLAGWGELARLADGLERGTLAPQGDLEDAVDAIAHAASSLTVRAAGALTGLRVALPDHLDAGVFEEALRARLAEHGWGDVALSVVPTAGRVRLLGGTHT